MYHNTSCLLALTALPNCASPLRPELRPKLIHSHAGAGQLTQLSHIFNRFHQASMRLGRRHSCTITHWLKGITVNIWYCGSGKFATPTLPKALRNSGSWIYYLRWPSEVTGGHFFPPSLFRQKPLQPQVCYSLSTLCSFVWGLGWDGGGGGGGGVTCRGGRHMLLLLYGYLSEERHVLSDWEAIPSCWVAAPWCGLSQSPRATMAT